MPTGVLPLSELAKRLSRKESEVNKLRQQYENRLARLKERQQRLESELREVEGQIQAASPNGSMPPAQLPIAPIVAATNGMITPTASPCSWLAAASGADRSSVPPTSSAYAPSGARHAGLFWRLDHRHAALPVALAAPSQEVAGRSGPGFSRRRGRNIEILHPPHFDHFWPSRLVQLS